MKKGVLALVLVALLLIPILATSIVYAQVDPASSEGGPDLNAPTATNNDITISSQGGSNVFGSIGEFFKGRYNLWKGGSASLSDPTQKEQVGVTLRWMLLVLVVILVYSALASANFPESTFLKLLMSVVVGFLATFLITTQELLTTIQSYTALGMTFSIFFPIMILGFFTSIVVTKGNPTGIYLQKIMWLIYSVYLFLKTLALYILTQATWDSAKGAIIIPDWASYLSPIIKPFYAQFSAAGKTKEAVATELLNFVKSSYDTTILYLLLIVSIAIFVICVLGNKIVVAWLAKEKMDAEVQAQKEMIGRSHAYDKVRSEEMQKNK